MRWSAKCSWGRLPLIVWVPAEDLEELNENIVGFIEVVGEYRGPA